MTRQEAEQFILALPSVEGKQYANDKERPQAYRQILESGDCTELASMIKEISEMEQNRRGKMCIRDRDWPPEKIMGCLYALSNHAEKHYQKVSIPKRSGGFRTLLVPDPLLKNVQRNLLHHVLDGFTVSDSAAAYRKGASVAANAGMHQGRKIVMKMDIEDFFGSITFPMVLHHAFPAAYFPPPVGAMLAALCCCHDRLPQGAPASPAVSNLVMKPFDEYMDCLLYTSRCV